MWVLVMTVLWTLMARGGGVTVVRISLPLDQQLVLTLNSSIEYIVQLEQDSGQSLWPVRVRGELSQSADEAGGAGPVLLWARRGLTADTWQLAPPLLAVERTLCVTGDHAVCVGELSIDAWSIHISASCEGSLQLLATSSRDWQLTAGEDKTVSAAVGAARVMMYQWGDETALEIVLQSEDTVCATVAVMNYTCPLAQTLSALQQSGGMRMTMLNTASAYVKRSSYPLGFVITLVLQEDESACGLTDASASSDWLWDAALGKDENAVARDGGVREKVVSVTVEEVLSAGQYWLACLVPLLILLLVCAAAAVVLYAPFSCMRKQTETDIVGEEALPGSISGPSTDSDDDQPQSRADRTDSVDNTSLRLAALAQRRSRWLRQRRNRYLPLLTTVGVFYLLPALQLVAAFQLVLNVSGELDLCYYNQLCARPLGPLSDFNHVFSNIGYITLGALVVAQTRLRPSPNLPSCGVPPQSGLLSALGVGLALLGFMSAAYHICPNRLNFQFDTAFMYVTSVLVMVVIHGSRRPDDSVRAEVALGALAGLMAFVVGGVLGGGAAFWAVWTALHISGSLALSLRVYYVKGERLRQWRQGLSSVKTRPRHLATLVTLLIANGANWALALYGVVLQPSDFASHLLAVLLVNALLSILAYLANKLLHGERPIAAAWALLAAAALIWPGALYFFLWGASDWSTSPALSRHYNHRCLLLQFYDSHDLWHLLSAGALYCTLSALQVWDDDLAKVPRERIAVF